MIDEKLSVKELQYELLGVIIGLSRSLQADKKPKETTIKVLSNALMGIDSFNEDVLKIQIENIKNEKDEIIPECRFCGARCGRNDDFDVKLLLKDETETYKLKSLILLSVKSLARYLYQAYLQGYTNEEINSSIYKALFFIGYDCDKEILIPILLELGDTHLKCLAILAELQMNK